jgi:acetate kinase
MQLAIFLVLYKVSRHHADYVELQLERLNALVFTGGISQVLTAEEVERVVHFFYRKLLHFQQIPTLLIDRDYEVWTYGLRAIHQGERSPKEENA